MMGSLIFGVFIPFSLQITGLPYKCKKKDIKEFFRPLVPYSIRLPLGKGKKVTGFCYVGFRTEKELKKALIKDKLFLGKTLSIYILF